MAEQPDLAVVAGAMNNLSREQAVLATQFARIPNVPAFNGGAQLLAELQAFRTEVQAFRTDVRGQLQVCERRSGTCERRSRQTWRTCEPRSGRHAKQRK